MSASGNQLVLIHGFTGRADVWNEVITALASTCPCIAIDLPGHGHKAELAIPDSFTFAGVVENIAGELANVNIGHYNLWGYSLGGRIALQFALKYPDRVRRLILESTSPGLAESAERESRLHSDELLAERIESHGLESFVDYWVNLPLFASQKLLPAERQALARRLRLLGTAKGYAAALRGFSVGRQLPLHNRLRELAMPVLIITGELDQKYRQFGELMAHSIPNAQLRIIPGAGHAPHWERPVETATIAAEFISSS